LFAGQWDAGLPGGLATARRSEYCLNALAAPGSDVEPYQDANTEWSSEQSLIRSMLLMTFASSGVPCLSMTALASSDLVRFVGLLAAIRKSYRGLLSPRMTARREVQWYGLGAPVDWSGESSSPTANVIAMTVQDVASSATKRAVCIAINPTPDAATLTLPMAPSGSYWRLVVNSSVAPPGDATLDGPVLPPGASQSIGPKSGLMLLAVPRQ